MCNLLGMGRGAIDGTMPVQTIVLDRHDFGVGPFEEALNHMERHRPAVPETRWRVLTITRDLQRSGELEIVFEDLGRYSQPDYATCAVTRRDHVLEFGEWTHGLGTRFSARVFRHMVQKAMQAARQENLERAIRRAMDETKRLQEELEAERTRHDMTDDEDEGDRSSPELLTLDEMSQRRKAIAMEERYPLTQPPKDIDMDHSSESDDDDDSSEGKMTDDANGVGANSSPVLYEIDS